jgi:hypothetical protein
MDGDKIAPWGKRRSKAFHFAMVAVAADGGAAGISNRWSIGFPRKNRRGPAYSRKHLNATIPIQISRVARLTRSYALESSTQAVYQRSVMSRFFLRLSVTIGLQKD